jgi:hypothetical protein
MANANYFPRDVMQQLQFPNVLIEFFLNLHDRTGGAQGVTQNLVEINTSVTNVESNADASAGPDMIGTYAAIEIERLKRRIEQLETLL